MGVPVAAVLVIRLMECRSLRAVGAAEQEATQRLQEAQQQREQAQAEAPAADTAEAAGIARDAKELRAEVRRAALRNCFLAFFVMYPSLPLGS